MPNVARLASLFILLSCLNSAPAEASEPYRRDLNAPGDELVTFDPGTGLEWLDPSVTAWLSYEDIVAGVGGFAAAGWRHATLSELCNLQASSVLSVPCGEEFTITEYSTSEIESFSSWWTLLGASGPFGCSLQTDAAYDGGGPAEAGRFRINLPFGLPNVAPCELGPSPPDTVTTVFEFVTVARNEPVGGHLLVRTACSDGQDQDGDGLVDLADPDCADPNDASEWSLAEGDILVADLHLYRVDPASGATTLLASYVEASGVAAVADGTVYFFDEFRSRIYRIDPDGRMPVIYVDPPNNWDQLLTSTADGRLAFESGGTLRLLDPIAGPIDALGSTGGRPEGLTVTPSGTVVWGHWGLREKNPGAAGYVELADVESLDVGPMDVAPDGSLLFLARNTEELYRVPLPFGTAEEPVALSDGLAPADMDVLAVESDGSWLLSAAWPEKAILRFPAGGGSPETLSSEGPIVNPQQVVVFRPPVDGPQCANGIDDDHDGQADAVDPDCSDASDDSEWHLVAGEPLAIANGVVARVDPLSGAATVLTSAGQVGGVGLGIDGALYVTEDGGIMRLDPADGSKVRVAFTEGAQPFAIDGAGVLYHGGPDYNPSFLYVVDTTTGSWSGSSYPFYDELGGLVVEPAGTLVAVEGPSLARIDPATFSVTTLWSSFSRPIGGIELEASGDLLFINRYVFGPNEIRRFDLQGGGSSTLLETLPAGHAGGIIVEPDGSWLAASEGGLYRFANGVGPAILLRSTAQDLELFQVELPSGATGPPACANGLDDDGDGLVDLGDPHCADASDGTEGPTACGLGTEIAFLLPLLRRLRRRCRAARA